MHYASLSKEAQIAKFFILSCDKKEVLLLVTFPPPYSFLRFESIGYVALQLGLIYVHKHFEQHIFLSFSARNSVPFPV